jgi:tRNA-dihydrouridine synthase B
MQDVTNKPFMDVVAGYGPPDYFFTEFFRVHESSRLEPHILRSITENVTGRPVFAQLIGEDLEAIGRTIRELAPYPIAGIDLNLGCPAPKVYKKNVGGGLLRDPDRLDRILGEMREGIDGLFTVKMRTGFDDTRHFDRLLVLMQKHQVDLLSLHARTVKDSYKSRVDYTYIKAAVERLPCPVFANGNITSATKAVKVVRYTGCFGVMVGRSAIRNPWIFTQTRQELSGMSVYRPTLSDIHGYIEKLFQATWNEGIPERAHLGRLKKFLNFIALGVEPEGKFLYDIRRVHSHDEFWQVCRVYLLEGGRENEPFADEPYDGLVARPNCELADTRDLPECCA